MQVCEREFHKFMDRFAGMASPKAHRPMSGEAHEIYTYHSDQNGHEIGIRVIGFSETTHHIYPWAVASAGP